MAFLPVCAGVATFVVYQTRKESKRRDEMNALAEKWRREDAIRENNEQRERFMRPEAIIARAPHAYEMALKKCKDPKQFCGLKAEYEYYKGWSGPSGDEPHEMVMRDAAYAIKLACPEVERNS